MSGRRLIAVAAAACVGCCIGPILAALGAVAALGAISTAWIGAAGLVIAGLALAAIVLIRRRRTCPPVPENVPVELTRR